MAVVFATTWGLALKCHCIEVRGGEPATLGQRGLIDLSLLPELSDNIKNNSNVIIKQCII